MPYIKVDVEKIKDYQRIVFDIKNHVKSISDECALVSYQLDYAIKDNNNINRRLQNIESTLLDHNLLLQRANTFLSNTSLKYVNAENNLYSTNKTNGKASYTDIDEIIKSIASQNNLPSKDVANVVLSGEYSIEEITRYADGDDTVGALAVSIEKLSNTNDYSENQYSEEQKKEIIALAAQELGVSESDIHENISQGLSTIDDVVEFLEGKAKETNKFVKNLSKTVKKFTGATKVLFTVKDGYVIVSKFSRNSIFNKLVQTFHDGTGLGTRYTVDGIKGTPIVGTVYTVDQIAKKVDKVVNVVTAVATGVSDVVEAGQKVNDIWANDDLSKKEKIIDTSAVVITSAIGTALDVAAPFAGTAVQNAVTGALSAVLPGAGVVVGAAVGYVAGQIVENGMRLVSDVITSEAVVNQVSDSIEKVGDAVTSGVQAVSNAGQKLMESKNAGEAIANTANLVGTAVVAGAKVVATTVVEGVKTAATVVAETAKAVANSVVEGVKSTAKKVVNFFKKW